MDPCSYQVSYAFESLMANEFSNQNVPCAALIPRIRMLGLEPVCLVTGKLLKEAFNN